MPFKSKAQQRFMFAEHPEMAKEWADKTPDIKALPQHVKKMADGGMVQDEPGIQDATVSDGATLAALASLAGAIPELAGAAPEMLGSEAGEISLGGKAPEMEGMPAKIQVFSKGVMGKGTPNETTIWGVKGDPKDLLKEFGDEAPGSVPEHILKAKGLLPDTSIDATSQEAPNSFAKGGEVMDKTKTNSMSDIGTLAGLRDLLAKAHAGEDIHEAPKMNPEDENKEGSFLGDFSAHASTDSAGAQGYAFGGETNPKKETISAMENNPSAGFADGGDVLDTSNIMQSAVAPSAAPIDTENGGSGRVPFLSPQSQTNIALTGSDTVDPAFIQKLQAGQQRPPAPTVPNPVGQTLQTAQNIPSTNPGIYQGITADDRNALLQKLLAQKSSGANLAASGLAGLGDAISNSFGKGGQNTQGALREAQNQNINTRIGAMDTQRQQRMQDLQANLAQQENDPSSAYSQGMRSFYSQLTGKTFPSGISASMMKQAFPDYAKIFDSQLTAATAQRGQTLGAQEKLATKGPFQRLVDNIFGNKAEETLSNETGVSTPAQGNGGWSVVK